MSERFAFSIRDGCRFSGIGRTSLFEMIRTGKLRVRYLGRKILIRRDDLETLVEQLPTEYPKEI